MKKSTSRIFLILAICSFGLIPLCEECYNRYDQYISTKDKTDFNLTDNQHLNVTKCYGKGILWGSSTVDVSKYGHIEKAYINDKSKLQVLNNSVILLDKYRFRSIIDNAYVYNDGTLNLFGGVANIQASGSSFVTVSGGWEWRKSHLFATNNCLVTVSGGSVDISAKENATIVHTGGEAYILASDNCSVDISGGSGYLSVFGTCNASISGGELSHIEAYDSSKIQISGGKVGTVRAQKHSVVDISGGEIQQINTCDNSEVYIRGYDFRATGGLILLGDWIEGSGIFAGKWKNGVSFLIKLEQKSETRQIHLIPL